MPGSFNMHNDTLSNQTGVKIEPNREFAFTLQILRVTGVPAETEEKKQAVLSRYGNSNNNGHCIHIYVCLSA